MISNWRSRPAGKPVGVCVQEGKQERTGDCTCFFYIFFVIASGSSMYCFFVVVDLFLSSIFYTRQQSFGLATVSQKAKDDFQQVLTLRIISSRASLNLFALYNTVWGQGTFNLKKKAWHWKWMGEVKRSLGEVHILRNVTLSRYSASTFKRKPNNCKIVFRCIFPVAFAQIIERWRSKTKILA